MKNERKYTISELTQKRDYHKRMLAAYDNVLAGLEVIDGNSFQSGASEQLTIRDIEPLYTLKTTSAVDIVLELLNMREMTTSQLIQEFATRKSLDRKKAGQIVYPLLSRLKKEGYIESFKDGSMSGSYYRMLENKKHLV